MVGLLWDHAGAPIRNPSVVLKRRGDEEAVLFNPETGDANRVNRVGLAVWGLIDGSRTTRDIVHGIEERFVDLPKGFERDIIAFLSRLVERGYVGFEISRM